MKPVPSPFRIIRIDYGASLGVILCVVVWGLALATRFFDPEAAAFFLRIAPMTGAAGVTLSVWRIWTIRRCFDEGEEVPGEIISLRFFRGRGRIAYAFDFDGSRCEAGNMVQASRITRALSVGQAVRVMLNQKNPKRAYLREPYLADAADCRPDSYTTASAGG